MKLAAIVVGGLTAFASMQAAAVDDFARTISLIGMSGSTVYVQFAEGFSGGCKFNSLYIGEADNTTTKAYLATLLAARATGGKVAHIGYAVASDGTCSPTQIEI